MKLIPYAFFHGTCEEAMTTYQKILNGKFEIAGRYDNPEMQAPEEYKNKIMHSSLEFGGNTLFASDVMPGMHSEGSGQSVYLTVADVTPDDGRKIFDQLAEGGTIHVRYEKQFWGDWHGNLTDRFGISWMVNASE